MNCNPIINQAIKQLEDKLTRDSFDLIQLGNKRDALRYKLSRALKEEGVDNFGELNKPANVQDRDLLIKTVKTINKETTLFRPTEAYRAKVSEELDSLQKARLNIESLMGDSPTAAQLTEHGHIWDSIRDKSNLLDFTPEVNSRIKQLNKIRRSSNATPEAITKADVEYNILVAKSKGEVPNISDRLKQFKYDNTNLSEADNFIIDGLIDYSINTGKHTDMETILDSISTSKLHKRFSDFSSELLNSQGKPLGDMLDDFFGNVQGLKDAKTVYLDSTNSFTIDIAPSRTITLDTSGLSEGTGMGTQVYEKVFEMAERNDLTYMPGTLSNVNVFRLPINVAKHMKKYPNSEIFSKPFLDSMYHEILYTSDTLVKGDLKTMSTKNIALEGDRLGSTKEVRLGRSSLHIMKSIINKGFLSLSSLMLLGDYLDKEQPID